MHTLKAMDYSCTSVSHLQKNSFLQHQISAFAKLLKSDKVEKVTFLVNEMAFFLINS